MRRNSISFKSFPLLTTTAVYSYSGFIAVINEGYGMNFQRASDMCFQRHNANIWISGEHWIPSYECKLNADYS